MPHGPSETRSAAASTGRLSLRSTGIEGSAERGAGRTGGTSIASVLVVTLGQAGGRHNANMARRPKSSWAMCLVGEGGLDMAEGGVSEVVLDGAAQDVANAVLSDARLATAIARTPVGFMATPLSRS